MQTKICDSDAAMPLGNCYGRNLLAVPGGVYAGRRAALIQTQSDQIRLYLSSPSGRDWSVSQLVADDCADGAIDCVMDTGGHVYVAYAEATTRYLVFKKLTFEDGSWSVGTKRTVYDGGACYNPSIARASDGTLWLSFSRYVQPNRNVHVKSSSDDGLTWGSGSADAGEELSSGYMYSYSRVAVGSAIVCVIYAAGDGNLKMQSLPLAGGSWSQEQTIATGDIHDYNFDATFGPDGMLALVYENGGLYYREYDGANWGAVMPLDATAIVSSPQLLYRGNVPLVVYLYVWAGVKTTTMYVERSTGVFSSPAPLDGRAAFFATVLLYSGTSGSYQDLTGAASSSNPADVFHGTSNCLVRDVGDAVYVGLDNRFRLCECTLSTVGAGGMVAFCYWEGVGWKSFSPVAGSVTLEATVNDILLWQDYDHIPSDWQKCAIDGHNRFWVRIEVTSAFVTGPVGSHVTAISEARMLSFRR